MAEIEPRIQAQAPCDDALTFYDRQHFLTYARLIDADREGANWKSSAAKILQRDVENDPHGAELCYRSHLARARWLVGAGLDKFLDDDSPD
jgi:hypothetical protein